MFKSLSRLFPKKYAGRGQLLTAVIVIVGAVILLSGGGKRLTDAFQNINDANYISAVSLVMSGVPKEALPVTLLDVDDRTRKAWGNAPGTPHAAIAELIRQSSSHGAAAIVVDFDLSSETAGAQADPMLLDVLANYPADAPPLMLARKVSFGLSEGAAGVETVAQEGVATPYDAAIKDKINIYWITTLNDISGDRLVQRIRLWQTVCQGAGGVTYPSAALVAAALLFPEARHDREMSGFLEDQTATTCRHATMTDPAWPITRQQAATLPYVFADRVDTRALFRIARDGKRTVVLRRISAGQIVTLQDGLAKVAGEIDKDPFEGRVVMLGSTHADSGDFYNTPLGTMPGVIILANSIVQAKKIAETVAMAAWLGNVWALMLFLIFAYIARKLQGAPSIIAIGVLALAALFAISRLYGFAAGVEVITVAVPGFALFKLVDSFAQMAMDVPTKGWRVLLKK